jgi:carbon-monoxide dehydrogenase medium subunit
VKIASAQGARTIALEEFFVGPGRTALQDNELVQELSLPAPQPHTGAAFFRRTRTAMDIAVVCGATMLQMRSGACEQARIALGAVGPTPQRAISAEAALRGQTLSDQVKDQARRLASEEARPIDDVRSTAEYRREMVRVLTRRGLRQALERARA